MQLEGGALMQDDFVKFSKDYVLFAHVTSRVATDKHQDLLQDKGGRGFPYIVFMDSEGNVIAKHESSRTAEGFAKTGEKASAYLATKAKAEKGDKAAKIEYAILRLELGIAEAAEVEAELKKVGKLTPEQQGRFDSALANAEIQSAISTIRNRQQQEKVQKKLYTRFKEDKPAPTNGQAIYYYYTLVLQEALAQKDAASFEKALAPLRKEFGDNPRAQGFFTDMEKKLAELKAGAKQE